AHTQAMAFFRIALDRAGPLVPEVEAGLLEELAAECYLTDHLEHALAACRRAVVLRREAGALAAVSANHHSLSVYEWYNADRPAAEHHVTQAVAVLDGRVDEQPEPGSAMTNLGHAIAMQGYLAVQA